MRAGKTAYIRMAVRAQAERGLHVIVLVPNEESESALLTHMADWSEEARKNVAIRDSNAEIGYVSPSIADLFERGERKPE